MTYEELIDYAKSQFTLTQTEINDCRPYVDDLCMPFIAYREIHVVIPSGIRFCLENGDSIIYVKKRNEPTKEGEHNES